MDWRYAFEGKQAPAFDKYYLFAFANAAICTMFSHYNVDIAPAVEIKKTDEEIEEMIHKNREAYLETNMKYIQKKMLLSV